MLPLLEGTAHSSEQFSLRIFRSLQRMVAQLSGMAHLGSSAVLLQSFNLSVQLDLLNEESCRRNRSIPWVSHMHPMCTEYISLRLPG